jgi:hypothetical protein
MSTSIHTATRVEIVNGALADCQASLQASYDYIKDSKLSFHQSGKKKDELLEQINISLTILGLMKMGSTS